jgi:mono/diheme cytochrome c family protein
MPSTTRNAALLLLVASTGAAAAATAAPPAATGHTLAESVCASCHVVEDGQGQPPILDPPAPSFMEIANRQGVKAAALRRFVSRTHWDEKTLPISMPNPELMPDQVRAVVDYLLSLKRP